MMSSLLLSSSPAKAQEKSLPTNRISPGNNTLNENLPPQRSRSYGGTLVWGVANQPTIINPILTHVSVSAALMELIFDSLVRIDSQGQVVPGLAESWDISEDGLEYTFYLRDDVFFHDGVQFTAKDVKFTYEQINDSRNQSPWRSNTEPVDHWEVLDERTLKVILKEPFVPLLYKLVREIVPKHLLEQQNLELNSFNYHPIGTGPFQLKNWDKETNQIELAANPDYFEGRPYLDKIIVKTYSDNAQLWAALMRHEVDLVQFISKEDYLVLKKDPSFRTYAVSGCMYSAIVYNPRDFILRDIEVRRAIAHGIDIEKIIAEVSESGGIKSSGPFHPDSMGFNPEVKPLEHDPVKAKMMLMHRGWQDEDKDGVLEKAGRELEIKLLIDERNDIYKKMATLVRQQLSGIGIKIKVQYYQDECELNEEFLDLHKPQAWLRYFSGLGFEGYDATGAFYSLSSRFGKLWDYRNNEVDALFESGKTAQDKGKRAELYKEIHKIIYDEQPACFLFFPQSLFAINARFKNTDAYFNNHMPTYTIKDWYIDN